MEVSYLLFLLTPPVFAYYSGYIPRHHPRQELVGHIAKSEFLVYTFISIHGLACTGISASVSGDSRISSLKKGIPVSLPLSLCGHIEQSNVLELLCHCNFDISHGFLARSGFQRANWSRCQLSRYPYNSDMRLMSFVESTVEQGRNGLHDCAVLTDHKLRRYSLSSWQVSRYLCRR